MNDMDKLITDTVLELYHKGAWLEGGDDNFPVAEFRMVCKINDPAHPTKEDHEYASRMATIVRDKFKPMLPNYTIKVRYRFTTEMIPLKQIINGLIFMQAGDNHG